MFLQKHRMDQLNTVEPLTFLSVDSLDVNEMYYIII